MQIVPLFLCPNLCASLDSVNLAQLGLGSKRAELRDFYAIEKGWAADVQVARTRKARQGWSPLPLSPTAPLSARLLPVSFKAGLII